MHTFDEKRKRGRPKRFDVHDPERHDGTHVPTLDELSRRAVIGRDVAEWCDQFHRDAAGAWKRFGKLSVYRGAHVAGERPTAAPMGRPRNARADRRAVDVPRTAACFVVGVLHGITLDAVRRAIDNSEAYQQTRREIRARNRAVAERRTRQRRVARQRI